MRKKNGYLLFLIVAIIGFYACGKDDAFNAAGGQLPTHYITFKDSSFSPSLSTQSNGANFTFLNQSFSSITVVGDDTTILKPVTILPQSSYFFKPDTIPNPAAQVYIPYHCVETPSAKGLIILNP